MRLVKTLIAICIGATAFSCRDNIAVDVPSSEPGIVIEGRVTDSIPVYAELSTTGDYFSQGQTPRISNASVFLMENGNTVSTLTENDSIPGLYESAYTGSVGNSYTLRVEVPSSAPAEIRGTWLTKPQKLKRGIDIDSLNIRELDKNTVPPVFEEGNYALAYYREPAGQGDFYRVKRWLNDSLFKRDILVVQDENIDGLYIGRGPIPAFNFYGPFEEPGDSITLEVASITRDYFDFLRILQEQTRVGSPFDPPPATLTGNIYKASDTTRLGFGYFSASSVNSKGITYKL